MTKKNKLLLMGCILSGLLLIWISTVLKKYAEWDTNGIKLTAEELQWDLDSKGNCPSYTDWSHPRYCTVAGNNTLKIGVPIDVPRDLLREVGIPLKDFVRLTRKNVNEFVFATAANDDYFHSAMDAIGNIQRYFSNRSIYFYDLSHNRPKEHVNKIRNLCRVIYRKFNYTRYPTHVANLKTYTFKPLIVHEMLSEFSGVFWVDSSIRFQTNNISSVLNQAYGNRGIITFNPSGHSNYAATHDGMYRFLPISASAASNTQQRDANSILFYRTPEVYTKTVVWWVLCALKENCMAAGKQLYCNFKGTAVWAGCHRFDQSAINILLANQFNYDDRRYLSAEQVLSVERGSSHKELLKICLPSFQSQKSAKYFQ